MKKIMLWDKIKEKLFFMRIGFKIALFYFIIILISTTISSVIFQRITYDFARNKVGEVSVQTLSSVQLSIKLMFENANNYSKIIFSDNTLQNLLRRNNIYSNLQMQDNLSKYIYNLIQDIPIIESVCIFDNSGNVYTLGKTTPPIFLLDSVKDAQWYEEVANKRGAYILRLNCSGAFELNSDANVVSVIRQIRDIENTEPLGILIINIPEKALHQAYSNAMDETTLSMAVLDESNNIVIQESSDPEKNALLQMLYKDKAPIATKLSGEESGYFLQKTGASNYLVSYLTESRYNWKYISIIPYDKITHKNTSLGLVLLLILFINGIILFFGSVVISRIVTVPIKALLLTMKGVEAGDFHGAEIETQSYEFKKLINAYNIMIMKIKHLIERIVEEQNFIRKAELDAIQAQIKPHFLYNTLDSITSLALSGNNAQVCDLVEALGSYYRISVSKGRDVISVGDEIEIAKNYLKIQKMRYQELFDVKYNIDQSCCHYSVLKLVLQPLVENSIYHGIRGRGESGIIIVSVHRTEQGIELSVEDDGIGMSEEVIANIMNRESAAARNSFGLWGTLERMRIFYGQADCFRLESKSGYGTKITLIIPEEPYIW